VSDVMVEKSSVANLHHLTGHYLFLSFPGT
jgi:hypothetical protein